ncbi:GyrI-like domain-containing protein [Peribacillus simplex]|uniref:GyrI-like domain-containing protein n=1 Tax=Bacillaceae TaxID=186817 RepID=UPI000660AA74|nr:MULTISPECIES: GyrI-like domain-containing protein [Bacillaceae]MCP1094703.1 GyrI-like domain-containing protein [Bacillaceae bacterium OS4b]MBD8591627.1 GyrI-like domain-containing protein [Peribacillus simplex]MCF7624550.1 GyrI-like domain-containing protein [Peribacillus frigoritolerans]MEA3577250.1 GyrI-like domain-containing protein [Peribacillus frigoritolerans]PRA78684.1 AraC family transcriptional regulator [Peribacillus simplex]
MSFKKVKKEFKLVGLKGSGEFVNFGNEVPLLAKQLLSRSNEILNSKETEIALFEPKKNEEHRIGHYYVGLVVSEKLNEVPSGMDYIETVKSYVTTRGNISNLGVLHLNLLNWAEEQDYQRDLDSYIIETYHPMVEGEEEVQIYLPIQA